MQFKKIEGQVFLLNWIKITLITYLIIVFVSLILDLVNLKEFDFLNNFLIKDFLVNREGILVSIAAIFIGIYISLYTLFLSIKSQSIIVKLGNKIFKELLSYVTAGIISSGIYLIYVILSPVLTLLNEFWIAKYIYEVILGFLVIYMILSATRVLLIFVIIFNKDLNSIYAQTVQENEEFEDLKDILYRMKLLLDAKEREEEIPNVEELNKYIESQKFKKKK